MGSTRQIDVRVEIDGLVVAVEAEVGSRPGAWRDAQNRLDQTVSGELSVDAAVAVCYPPGSLIASLTPDSEIEWAILPDREFSFGRVRDLADAMKRLPEDQGDPERQARILESALKLATSRLTDRQRRDLAAALNLPSFQKVNGRTRDTTVAAATRGLLVIAAAAMFHCRLDDYLGDACPTVDNRTINSDNPTGEPYTGTWPPLKLQMCYESSDVVGSLFDAWQMILAVDYRPIFEAACVALLAPTQNSRWSSGVRAVVGASLRVSRAASASRHDLLGRIFHRLLDSARFDGSYYTSTSAAVILAGLAIPDADLSQGQGFTALRVIDPACGTGTLLMAAAERLCDLRGPESTAADATLLIEDIIWGIDVNTTACHMAATTLGLLSSSTSFRKMNIYMMPLAFDGAQARVGSLELLAAPESRLAGQMYLTIGWSAGRQVDTGVAVEINPNSFDLVIMNPPYTRDSLRHDQFSAEEERMLKAREKELMRGRHGHGSSSGTMFADLGEHLCSLEDGAVYAFVAPSAMSASASAVKVRELLAAWFHVEWVIYSHDPQRTCFSENTDISEILVVCRRHSADPSERPPTKFACLLTNPVQVTQASAITSMLRAGTIAPEVGDVTEWPAVNMVQGEWLALGLRSAYLRELSSRLRSTCVTLGQVALVGPAGQRIRDVYRKERHSDAEGRRALWHNDTGKCSTLRMDTDVYLHVKEGERSRRLADRYWAQRSHLLLAVSPRLTTARVVAVWVPVPTVGSHWVPVRPDPAKLENDYAGVWEKAMCVWFNSTPGILSVVATSSPRIMERPYLSLNAMRRLPVPELTADQAQEFALVFDRVGLSEVYPLSAIHSDRVRRDLDNAVASVLRLTTPEEAAMARAELAREPAVTG